MRAAVCPAHGPPDVVRIEEQASEPLEPGQVRVKVGAAAVNFPDVLLIANEYQISVPPPFVPGSEFAGVIVETSDGADGFAVGERVAGTGLYGAFAEEVVVHAAVRAGGRRVDRAWRRRGSRPCGGPARRAARRLGHSRRIISRKA
jgi:NADPH2:quinone reductase